MDVREEWYWVPEGVRNHLLGLRLRLSLEDEGSQVLIWDAEGVTARAFVARRKVNAGR